MNKMSSKIKVSTAALIISLVNFILLPAMWFRLDTEGKVAKGVLSIPAVIFRVTKYGYGITRSLLADLNDGAAIGNSRELIGILAFIATICYAIVFIFLIVTHIVAIRKINKNPATIKVVPATILNTVIVFITPTICLCAYTIYEGGVFYKAAIPHIGFFIALILYVAVKVFTYQDKDAQKDSDAISDSANGDNSSNINKAEADKEKDSSEWDMDKWI